MLANHPFIPLRQRLPEALYLVLMVLLAFHVIGERIDHRFLPSGDEGSWMAAAAELSAGNGFTTRWLEYGFLKPWTLPRPDDFRYPALVSLLAAGFALFGRSYTTGLWVVGATFILFGLAVYGVVRRAYGRRTAAATLPLVYLSLLQLRYNTVVYTEALFGIGIALLIYVSVRFRPSQTPWWLWSGAGIGLLYLIRPNAVLFAAAFICFGLAAVWRKKISFKPVAIGVCIMAAVMLPWLLRTWIHFGNPFHLAGSAGLLRVYDTDPSTWSVFDFSSVYGAFYFLKTTLAGIPNYVELLHEQEHGLELIPLVFVAIGIISKRPFFNGMILIGFVLSFLACCYASANGAWAGNRYFMPFLPFVYAYGIHRLFFLTDHIIAKIRLPHTGVVSASVSAVLAAALLLPVVYPHRYYERFFKTTPAQARDYSAYYRILREKLADHPFYYAGSLAQINFSTNFNCVGMQFRFDDVELRLAQKTFNPRLMALRPGEFQQPFFTRLMDTLKADGHTLTVTEVDTFAVIIDIHKGTSGNSIFTKGTGPVLQAGEMNHRFLSLNF